MTASSVSGRPPVEHSQFPLIIAASVSTLGGLLFGYDNIVISGAIGYLSQLFHLNAAGVGWAASCALVGCIVGCAAAGTVADFWARKWGWGFAHCVSRFRRQECFSQRIFINLLCGG